MKAAASDHAAVRFQQVGKLVPRRWPIATVSVLAVTAVLTVLQYPFPQVRLALWRDPNALAAGQWWRLVTPLFVQYDAVWQIVVVSPASLGSVSWPSGSSGMAGGCCIWVAA